MKTIYTVESELLSQRITITETDGKYEIDTEDGVHYSDREVFLCCFADTRPKFPKRVHRIKKLFDGEVTGIEYLKDH